jgi:signal transduction histidine kinase
MITSPEKIRFRILVPIGCVVLLILFGGVSSIYWLQYLENESNSHKKTSAVKSHFKHQISHETQLLGSLLEFIKEDKKLAQLWLQKDRDALLKYSIPLLERIKTWNRVTHIYFIATDKTCFLRTHKPDSYGDIIDRYTMNRAVATGSLASGLELGRFGLLSIRMVQPWIIDGKLAGYLELAMEIDHILLQVAKESEVMLMLAINKQNIDRNKWEEGQKMIGHNAEWDRFEKVVICDSSEDMSTFPLDRNLNFRGADIEKPVKLASGGHYFNRVLIPQKDVSGKEVGGIIVLNDITDSIDKMHALSFRLIIFSISIAGILFLFFNTYVRNIQNGLISAREELLREIEGHKKTTMSLLEAKEIAEAANKDLESFSYSVTHDLRSPLTLINGYVSLLLETYGSKLDDSGRDYLQTVLSRCEQMDEFIDDMLTFSRANQEIIRRDPVDLSSMARIIMADHQLAEPERKLTLTIADGLSAKGNPQLLRTAMENLLGNAWKFSARKSESIIEFGTLVRENTRVFFVRDNGAGFDMKHADDLFIPLKRLHRRNDFEGSGIGLATVEKIITRHGGQIWAEGVPGEGAVFFFTIPDDVDNCTS